MSGGASGSNGESTKPVRRVGIFIPYWGIVQVIQSTAKDADENSQKIKQACINLLYPTEIILRQQKFENCH